MYVDLWPLFYAAIGAISMLAFQWLIRISPQMIDIREAELAQQRALAELCAWSRDAIEFIEVGPDNSERKDLDDRYENIVWRL